MNYCFSHMIFYANSTYVHLAGPYPSVLDDPPPVQRVPSDAVPGRQNPLGGDQSAAAGPGRVVAVVVGGEHSLEKGN